MKTRQDLDNTGKSYDENSIGEKPQKFGTKEKIVTSSTISDRKEKSFGIEINPTSTNVKIIHSSKIFQITQITKKAILKDWKLHQKPPEEGIPETDTVVEI